MRVTIIKATGQIFEAQSGGVAAPLQAMMTNAMAAGYLSTDVDVKFISDADYAALLAALPPPIPPSISGRQFYQQLANQSIITQAEALAANGAVIPAVLLTLVAGLPSGQQFAAKMLLSGATAINRDHWLTLAFATAYGWTDAQTDTFFIAAAAL